MADQPTTWQFTGPFEAEDYENIQKQNPLVKTSGGKDDLNKSVYASKYGVRSRFPRSTPKYARYAGIRHHEFVETTARMYLQVRDPELLYREIGSIGDKNLEALARVLAGRHEAGKLPEGGYGYIDFFLQQANHSLNEKMQVVETLSDNYVAFFFGQQAPVFQYSGSLMNTYQDDWAINMLRLYQNLGRGSQLARRGLLFYLKYDSIVVSGSLLNLNWSITGDIEIVVPFSFNFLVRKIHILYNQLEPPTNLWIDNLVDDQGAAMFPTGYNPNEAGRASIQGKIHDNLGVDTTYGASTGSAVSGGSAETPEKTADGSPGNGDGAGSEQDAVEKDYSEEVRQAYDDAAGIG